MLTLNQAYLFYIFILTGTLIGVVFDVFRILRKSFKTSDLITYIQDIIFWIIAGFILIYTIFKFNNGELRSYVLIGIALGLGIYLIIFSKTFIKINVTVINFIKKIVVKTFNIITYPFKILFTLFRKVLLKPISFIFINLRKSIKSFFKNKLSNFKLDGKIIKKKVKKVPE